MRRRARRIPSRTSGPGGAARKTSAARPERSPDVERPRVSELDVVARPCRRTPATTRVRPSRVMDPNGLGSSRDGFAEAPRRSLRAEPSRRPSGNPSSAASAQRRPPTTPLGIAGCGARAPAESAAGVERARRCASRCRPEEGLPLRTSREREARRTFAGDCAAPPGRRSGIGGGTSVVPRCGRAPSDPDT